jgi:hypothetical protein
MIMLFRSSPLKKATWMLASFGLLVAFSFSINYALSLLSTGKSGHYVIPTYINGDIVRIVPQVPLYEPLFSDAEIMDFSTEAMHEVLSVSFDNYKRSMTDAATLYFTSTGWTAFSKEFTNSELYANIFTDREIIEFYPSRAPFLVFSGLIDGTVNGEFQKDAYWAWRIKVDGVLIRKSINKPKKGEKYDINKRRKMADVSFILDLQRVPKGKGASAVKIINTDSWEIRRS